MTYLDEVIGETEEKICKGKKCKCKTLPANPYEDIRINNKLSNYDKTAIIENFIKNTPNDMLLGEAVRKLLS